MNASFRSFAIGLSMSVILLYLILVAQFKSFKDPFLIMLAVPMGFIGVLIILPLTGTTLNVMSLMGVLMLVGISASNSILIVEFAHRLEEQGNSVKEAIVTSCRVRLRPILMTSLATIIGMVPMALKLGTGSEQYAPLARAIIGGLTSSVLLTIFIVPAAYLLVYGKRDQQRATTLIIPHHLRLGSRDAAGLCADIRVRWALEEAGLPYRVNSVPFGARNAEHFSHQPFGQSAVVDRWRHLDLRERRDPASSRRA